MPRTHRDVQASQDDVSRHGRMFTRPPQAVNRVWRLQMQPHVKTSNDKQSEAALYLIESGLRLGVEHHGAVNSRDGSTGFPIADWGGGWGVWMIARADWGKGGGCC